MQGKATAAPSHGKKPWKMPDLMAVGWLNWHVTNWVFQVKWAQLCARNIQYKEAMCMSGPTTSPSSQAHGDGNEGRLMVVKKMVSKAADQLICSSPMKSCPMSNPKILTKEPSKRSTVTWDRQSWWWSNPQTEGGVGNIWQRWNAPRNRLGSCEAVRHAAAQKVHLVKPRFCLCHQLPCWWSHVQKTCRFHQHYQLKVFTSQNFRILSILSPNQLRHCHPKEQCIFEESCQIPPARVQTSDCLASP